MKKFLFTLDLQMFNEGAAAPNPGVDPAGVAGQQSSSTATPPVDPGQTGGASTATQPPGVDPAGAAGQLKDEKDFSAALKARETQMRQQLDKEYQDKYAPHQTNSQYLEKLAKIEGFPDLPSYLKAIDEYEQRKTIEAEAKRLGVDEETYKQYMQPVNQRLSAAEQELQQLRKERALAQIDQEIAAMRAQHPDFDTYQDKIFELAIQRGYSIADAYKIASFEDKISSTKTAAEQEAIEKLKQNSSTSTGSLSQGGDEKHGFASMTPAQQRAFIDKVKRGEITELP